MKSQRISSSPAGRTLPARLSPVNEKPAFKDSRLSTQRQTQLVRDITQYPSLATSQMKKVIQRASPDEWFDGIFAADGNATISVYSHILSDGYGDAGQLGNAVHELNYLKNRNIVQAVIPYASYTHPKVGTTEEDWRKNIVDLCPELQDSPGNANCRLQKTDTEESGWLPQCCHRNNWELQFPVPALSMANPDSKRMLRVFEMGMSEGAKRRYEEMYPIDHVGKHKEPLYHTGVSDIKEHSTENKAVGYLIPSYREENKDKGMIELIQALRLNPTSIYELPSYLRDAWFVKLNNPQNALRVIKIATTSPNHCQKMILQGVAPNPNFQRFGIPVYTIPGRVSQSCLDCLMACITEGKICAGGEGMFVQALGVSTAKVSLIPQEGRNYGYQQGQYVKDSMFPINYFNYDTGDPINSLRLLLEPNFEEVTKAQNANARQNNFFSRYMYSRFQSPPSMQPPTSSMAASGILPPLSGTQHTSLAASKRPPYHSTHPQGLFKKHPSPLFLRHRQKK